MENSERCRSVLSNYTRIHFTWCKYKINEENCQFDKTDI